jgi:hypothetical protein
MSSRLESEKPVRFASGIGLLMRGPTTSTTVVSANCKPETVLIALKANSTRKLREAGFWHRSTSPWADRGGKRYLWTEKDVNDAAAYVQYDQGEPLP